MITACVTAPERPAWPADMPPRTYYDSIYADDRQNQEYQSRSEYLQWVKAFYNGWGGISGWRSIRDRILADANAAERKHLRPRLDDLGKRIAGEWAKARGQRLISSETIQVWINATYEASGRSDYQPLLNKISGDVDALLAGSMDASVITLGRYYPDAGASQPFSDLKIDTTQ